MFNAQKWPSLSQGLCVVEKDGSGLLWPSFTLQKGQENRDEFEKFIPFLIDKAAKDKDEHIVSGVVYEPDEVDSQGEFASAETIRKAAYQFMQDVQKLKVNHKGKEANIKILESYVAPQDLTIANVKVKKGTWVLTARVLDDKIWKAIKDGTLSGFSMAGRAQRA